MEPADSIVRLGFRRWYERQLIEGHAWLVTCVLCMLCVAASLEGLSLRGAGWEPLLKIGFVFAGGLIGWHAWTRYKAVMSEAERIADRSTCEACGTYGRMRIVGSGARAMSVACGKCGHAWEIE
jgi:predicted Zn finger-like uncharacterized protein